MFYVSFEQWIYTFFVCDIFAATGLQNNDMAERTKKNKCLLRTGDLQYIHVTIETVTANLCYT